MKITKNKEMILNEKEAEEYMDMCKKFIGISDVIENWKFIRNDYEIKKSTVEILKTDIHFYKKDNWTKKAIIASYKKDIETKNQIIEIYETENKFNRSIIEGYKKNIEVKNAIIGLGVAVLAMLAIKMLIN